MQYKLPLTVYHFWAPFFSGSVLELPRRGR